MVGIWGGVCLKDTGIAIIYSSGPKGYIGQENLNNGVYKLEGVRKGFGRMAIAYIVYRAHMKPQIKCGIKGPSQMM